MASANLSVARKVDWPLANPWLWLTAGLALCTWSWLWTLTFGANSSELRIIFLAVGLLFAGVGNWMRFSDRETAFLNASLPALALLLRLAMGGLFALIALGISALFVATFFIGDEIGWRWAPTLLVWLSTAPLSAYAARRCLERNGKHGALDVEEEIGLAFVVGALCTFAGSWTLYLGPNFVEDWDTMRLFLRVLTVVALGGAGLVLVSTRLRRLVISFLFVLHFAGISNACLAAPPAPWLLQQTWMRIFRPYLEFMYLNNAYHFYAPEPGPASYLWFRLIYTDETGTEQGWWYKVPEIDDKGRHHHAVALEYQRHLAMCESVAGFDAPPPWVVPDGNGGLGVNPFYSIRMAHQPVQVIGEDRTAHPRIPMHPTVPWMQQVIIPNDGSKRLLSSYARFAAHKHAKHPEHENWTFKSVKVYRVIHFIPPVDWFVSHRSPSDPMLYRPFYMGNYNAAGDALDSEWGPKRDPYLYWLVPILPTDPNDPKSEIKDFCRRHAGDSEWIRPAGQTRWVNPRQPNL
jgi:hypothetical protein